MHNGREETENNINCQSDNKGAKLSIVSATNTCAEPSTMMIKVMYTIVAKVAMHSSLRSIYHTCITVLQFI